VIDAPDDLPRVATDITRLGPCVGVTGTKSGATIHLAAGDLIVTRDQLDSLGAMI
jgi:hypothetical protein